MDNQIFFGNIVKNQVLEIKVSLVEGDDYTQIDIRQWFIDRDDGPFPTKKGVRFDIAHFEVLQEAIEAIAKHLDSSKQGNDSNS